jgi:diamine N-acetyltransferase
MTVGKKRKSPSPESLALRPIERKDLPDIRAWKNDPIVRRWVMDGTRIFSDEEIERWLDRAEAALDRDRRWIVEESGRPLGFVGIYQIDPVSRHAEFGIMLGPEGRGRGVGKVATKLALEEAFSVLNLHRLYLHVLADHQAAQALYRQCGFREEGVLKDHNFKEGQYVDVVIMGLLASDYLAQRRVRRK